MPDVLIVEDERVLAGAMKDYLERQGYGVTVAGSGEDALGSIRRSEPDLVVLDYRLPGMNGLTLLREIRTLAPNIETVMMTAHGTVRTAVEAMRAGCFDYLTKPVDLEELLVVLEKAWEHSRLRREVGLLRSASDAEPAERIAGDSPETRELRAQVRRLAALDRGPAAAPPVLMTGETGTGKGLVARVLHDLGPRSARPFVEVNCAAIPATLLESEMFGYERGAFTDARGAKPGLFEAAEGGTLFLDEIGSMALELQVKLLKVIEEKSVRRLGGLRPKALDVRVVAATNADLEEAVQKGTFRADLLYRLNVLTLVLRPLRERRDDIAPLARHFVQHYGRRYGRQCRLTGDAERQLCAYRWPGNVRELSNVVERAVLLAEREEIGADDLGLAAPVRADGSVTIDAEAIRVDLSAGGVRFADIERTLLVEALRVAGGNRRRAAALLDLSFETLRYRMEKHGLAGRGDG